MVLIKNRLDDLLDQTEHTLVTALADPTIANALAEFGYDPERIASGMVLQREVQSLLRSIQQELHAHQLSLDDVHAALEKADPIYLRSLRIARLAFRDHPKIATLLKLHGERNISVAGWLDQTEAFYYNLSREAGLAQVMSGFGYTFHKIDAEYLLQKEVRDQHRRLFKALGEVPSATEKRDRRFIQLDAWMSDFRAVAKVALADHPQQLRRLAITASC